jgi:hypothetical protein
MTGKMKMIGIVAVAVFCVIAASLSYAQNQKVAVSPSVQKAATIDTGIKRPANSAPRREDVATEARQGASFLDERGLPRASAFIPQG